MALDAYRNRPDEIQDYLEKLLASESFRGMVHAGAEIPNYILPYPVKKSDVFEQMARNIVKRLGQKGIAIRNINLYDELLFLIGDDLQDYLEAEDITKQELFEDFSNILDVNNRLTPHIADLIDSSSAEIIIFTGVGEAYPFIRVHALLEALPSRQKGKKPIVVFYPGAYDRRTGNSCFRLFDRLAPVNYYRAFNIFTEVR